MASATSREREVKRIFDSLVRAIDKNRPSPIIARRAGELLRWVPSGWDKWQWLEKMLGKKRYDRVRRALSDDSAPNGRPPAKAKK